MKTGWESAVLFQIPLCFLHVSYCFYSYKTTKRGGGDKNKHPLCPVPIAETTRQRITIKSIEFQIQGLIPFSSWWLVSLLIIRADRKIWLWCVCYRTPLGTERNSTVFLRFIKFLLSVVVKLPEARSCVAAMRSWYLERGHDSLWSQAHRKDPISQGPPCI